MKWLIFLFAITGYSMDQYLWKNRVIITPHLSLEAQKKVFNAEEVKDRDLVFIATPNQNYDKKTFYLIGKDGGIKARSQSPFESSYIYRLIDSMPMRQAEMKK